MIKSVFGYLNYLELVDKIANNSTFASKARMYLIESLEKRLKIQFVLDSDRFLMRRGELLGPTILYNKLRSAGIVLWLNRALRSPDSPFFYMWASAVKLEGNEHVTAGCSVHSEDNALYATLAEALERFIWFSQTDYFDSPVTETVEGIKTKGRYLSPDCFVGYSEEQKKHFLTKHNSGDYSDSYLWIKSKCLLNGGDVYIPAQIVSGAINARALNESPIRFQATGGLATWITAQGAQLVGLLELIERDAYYITWLNQLTLPRINLDSVEKFLSAPIKKLLKDCERYQLKVHVVKMVTDAPTFALMVVVEEEIGGHSHYCIGIKAHYNISKAIEGALLEALRAVQNYQKYFTDGKNWNTTIPAEKIDHKGRLIYWGQSDKAASLRFLVEGPFVAIDQNTPWLSDTDSAHMERLLGWCGSSNYSCVSVPLTKSEKNTTGLHVEMVVIPELYPVYLYESQQHQGVCERLQAVPLKFGYTPRPDAYFAEPHPFY